MRTEDVNRLIEQAIQGHASTRDAIEWAMKQAYLDGVESGIEAEREACAKVCDARYTGDNNREDMEAKRCAAAIRARGERPWVKTYAGGKPNYCTPEEIFTSKPN